VYKEVDKAPITGVAKLADALDSKSTILLGGDPSLPFRCQFLTVPPLRRSHDAVIRVFDVAGNVIEMHKHAVEFKVSDSI
jgi:hypothetical protein